MNLEMLLKDVKVQISERILEFTILERPHGTSGLMCWNLAPGGLGMLD